MTEPFPALTRIRVSSPFLKHLKGVKVEGLATLVPLGKSHGGFDQTTTGRESVARGEILFTETGLSGPPILDLSRRVGERVQQRKKSAVRLDLCPEFSTDQLAALLRERFSRRPALSSRWELSAELALVGFLNKRLIAPVLKVAGIPEPARSAAALGEREILAVAAVLKGWQFEVTGTDSWADAQVTAGGIDVADVQPATLESRLAPGLFFAGEVLDVDGDCGGFNLQWAWSSGHLAGTQAARRAAGSPGP